MIIVIVIASLAVGVVAGLWIKPAHMEFCPICYATLGCLACREVEDGTPRSPRTT